MLTFKDLCPFLFLSLLCAFGGKQPGTGSRCWHCQCLRLLEEKWRAGGKLRREQGSHSNIMISLCPTWVWFRQCGCCGSPWTLGFGVSSSLSFSWDHTALELAPLLLCLVQQNSSSHKFLSLQFDGIIKFWMTGPFSDHLLPFSSSI